jgi:hypothetical protein
MQAGCLHPDMFICIAFAMHAQRSDVQALLADERGSPRTPLHNADDKPPRTTTCRREAVLALAFSLCVVAAVASRSFAASPPRLSSAQQQQQSHHQQQQRKPLPAPKPGAVHSAAQWQGASGSTFVTPQSRCTVHPDGKFPVVLACELCVDHLPLQHVSSRVAVSVSVRLAGRVSRPPAATAGELPLLLDLRQEKLPSKQAACGHCPPGPQNCGATALPHLCCGVCQFERRLCSSSTHPSRISTAQVAAQLAGQHRRLQARGEKRRLRSCSHIFLKVHINTGDVHSAQPSRHIQAADRPRPALTAGCHPLRAVPEDTRPHAMAAG